jgi:AcrR family transcriptional regulator
MTNAAAPEPRRRLSPERRRAQLLEVAATLLVEKGAFPISMEDLARECSVVKGLVYAYFRSQEDLAAALVEKHLEDLEAKFYAVRLAETPGEIVYPILEVYFAHVVQHGPLLNILFDSDRSSGKLPVSALRHRDRLVLPLLRACRKYSELTARDLVAAFNIILAMPEEAGRLVYTGRASVESARVLTQALVASALRSLGVRMS